MMNCNDSVPQVYHMAMPFEQIQECYGKDPSDVKETEALMDCGATTNAGGKEAIESLLASVVRAKPKAKIEVRAERPYFRFGDGKWGQALYLAILSIGAISFSMYALDYPGVPLLFGMTGLQQVRVSVHFCTGKALVGGNLT